MSVGHIYIAVTSLFKIPDILQHMLIRSMSTEPVELITWLTAYKCVIRQEDTGGIMIMFPMNCR